jgi:NADH-quinone oxidoreductase subunit L
MLIMNIIILIIISIYIMILGNKIGYKGLLYIIIMILIISPIISWYILYNIIIINIYNNKLLYILYYKFINIYNNEIKIIIGINIYEFIIIILLININYMITLYIIKYLNNDKNIIRFMSIIILFTYNMIILIISNDIIILFLGWEMIGIISLLLINYYNNRIEATRSGIKAIMYNRIGDIGILILIMLSINIYNDNNINIYILLINYKYYNIIYNNINIIIGISIIIGAWSKSAQIGLQPWLLDAMEGPTPVSALLHSATLITAGILLLYKNIYILYYNHTLCILLLILGGISSILNSISSINYIDIKRIIAYSTCTHISLMIMILSIDIIINIKEISLLHLFYHGWSKSLIFLICGYFISIVYTQDIRLFGNFYQYIPIFFIIINICLLTIYGFPGSFLSFSKDLILEFGLISVYGYNFIFLFFLIILLSQGYSLGILLFLLFNNYFLNNIIDIKINIYFYLFIFLFIIIIIIYLPFLLNDILLYININILHNIFLIDPFSYISIIGLLFSFFNIFYFKFFYFFNINNNRLYFDKLISNFINKFSIFIIYYFIYFFEFFYIINYLYIINLIYLILLI